ncbi:MAG: phage major capsid protein [Treponema sp.]|nr:phage major capsid protein [Clostridia bacterium]MBP3606993.1 phage major capsid protein [Treponema sp.]
MPQINTNRWQLSSIKDGIASSLAEAKNKLAGMYSDSTSTLEDRNKQQEIVQDLTERLTGITNQINEIDAQVKTTENENMSVTDAFGGLVRAVMTNSSVSVNIKNALKDDSASGGDKLLPKTVSNQIITEPFAKNPLRKLSTVTAIENLELPKMAFSLSDDDFIEDGETAKELAATADTITFTRNKFKVFCDISETVLKGSNSNTLFLI